MMMMIAHDDVLLELFFINLVTLSISWSCKSRIPFFNIIIIQIFPSLKHPFLYVKFPPPIRLFLDSFRIRRNVYSSIDKLSSVDWYFCLFLLMFLGISRLFFCFVLVVKPFTSSPALHKTSSREVCTSLLLSISLRSTSILLISGNIFQIWSTLAG